MKRTMILIAATLTITAAVSLRWWSGDAIADKAKQPDTCEAACATRKACSVGTDTTCVSSCTAVKSLFAPGNLSTYAASDCKTVKSVEPAFQLAASCRRACDHRASCISGAAVEPCLAACTTIGYPADALTTYSQLKCPEVTKADGAFQIDQACVSGCVKVQKCGVKGELGQCFSMCKDGIAANKFDLAFVQSVPAKDCKWVKDNIAIPAAAPRTKADPGFKAWMGKSCRFNSYPDDCGWTSIGPSTCCPLKRFVGDTAGSCMSPPICAMGQ